jgi:hypothetical protein
MPTSESQAAPTKQGDHIIYMATNMIVYTIKQVEGGQWGICREDAFLFRELTLGPAIRLARDIARDEHHRSSRPTCVEMREGGSRINLARYPKKVDTAGQWEASAFSAY